MKYIIFPSLPTYRLQADALVEGVQTTSVGLGGCFYDYIVGADGVLRGIRYWTGADVQFLEHPVFNQFSHDDRFAFDQRCGFVDVFFDASSASDFREGKLLVDTVQDFGGDCVASRAGVLGICFEVPF